MQPGTTPQVPPSSAARDERPEASRGSLFRRALLGLAAVLALIASPLIAPSPANALVTTGFDAGQIISDGNFYAGKSMSSKQVQDFLNQRVPRCTIGDQGRAPGSAYGKTKIASKCLRDATFSSSSRASNAYCGAYAGGKNDSAATVITKVSAACGISPKVLIVMLEKEQSLITDTWPTVRQFDFAMGYDCPDSGPNNSANCNSGAGGFPSQVYRAAWQLKVYRAFPNDYNYRAGVTNTIQWHPTAGCGTSKVRIANSATAALYIYTPYRPNQAALAAGWGTGDSCSTYGNRNFYNFYKTWFGAPVLTVHAKLQQRYNDLGGAGGVLGEVVAAAVTGKNGAVGQQFEHGALYWSSAAGAQPVSGGIYTRHQSEGGLTGKLGVPLAAEESKRTGAAKQDFQGGSIYWGAKTGTYVINGVTLKLYRAKGDYLGYMGLPTSESISVGKGLARRNFEGATVYWSKAHGSFVLHGAVRSAYRSEGEAKGRLGSPIADERKLKGGAAQDFEHGTIYWSKKTGAHTVRGAILTTYQKLGESAGRLGNPLESEQKPKGSPTIQHFEKGAITWTRAGGTKVSYSGAAKSTAPDTDSDAGSTEDGVSGGADGADTTDGTTPDGAKPDDENPDGTKPEDDDQADRGDGADDPDAPPGEEDSDATESPEAPAELPSTPAAPGRSGATR